MDLFPGLIWPWENKSDYGTAYRDVSRVEVVEVVLLV